MVLCHLWCISSTVYRSHQHSGEQFAREWQLTAIAPHKVKELPVRKRDTYTPDGDPRSEARGLFELCLRSGPVAEEPDEPLGDEAEHDEDEHDDDGETDAAE